MALRYTVKDAGTCFALLARVLGKTGPVHVQDPTTKKWRSIPGAWELDCNPTYGGCRVEEITSEGGGVTHPLGDVRKTPAEFCGAVHFAVKVVDIDRKRK